MSAFKYTEEELERFSQVVPPKPVEVGLQIYHVRIPMSSDNPEPRSGIPPVATVALVWDSDGNLARGISICSQTDQWDRRRIGRPLAIARARRALRTRTSTLPVGFPIENRRSPDGDQIVRQAGLLFMHTWTDRYGDHALPECKSHFNPFRLTRFEAQLLRSFAAHNPGTPGTAGVGAIDARYRFGEIPDVVYYECAMETAAEAKVPDESESPT